MYRPLDMTFKQIRSSEKLYQKTIGHMMTVKGDRESLLNHEKFKIFLVEVMGVKTSEKVYNYMVFRHFHLMDEVDRLIKGVTKV